MKRFRGVIVVVVLIGGCITGELQCLRRADPTNRIANLPEYLVWRPDAEEFAAVEANGQRHVIAYGPYTRTFPSGPSASVFDPTGILVDWSFDIGDDSRFDDKWRAQLHRGGNLSRMDVENLAATLPGG